MELSCLIDKLLETNNFDHQDLNPLINKIKPNYPIILVGGTNGKGSVCAYLTTILTISGYKVGTYTSPHVFRYNERISINNTPVDDQILSEALENIMHQTSSPIGLFKTFTLAAHNIFINNNIDIAIVEVGIGGKHDITNAFTPEISVVTNVNFDHCELLGNTLEEIGKEKSGVYRSNKCGFYGSDTPVKSLINYANDIGCKLQIFGKDFGIKKQEFSFDVWCGNKNFYSLPYPQLRGETQPNNVALALAVLEKLREKFPVSTGMIKTGLLQTSLVGRFQVLPGSPQIILDVAHNSHSVTNMLSNMLKLPFAPQSVAVFGIAKEKDANQIIQLCKNSFDKWFIAKTSHQRGLDSEIISQILLNNGIEMQNIIKCESISMAYKQASLCTNARITCFGSFLVVEEAYNTILSTRK